MRSVRLSNFEFSEFKKYFKESQYKEEKLKSEDEALRIKSGDINFILYKSNSLVFKDTQKMRDLLKKKILKEASPFNFIIGSDEAGKGEWYGPLVIVALGIKPGNLIDYRLSGVKDSKALSNRKIRKFSEKFLSDDKIKFERIILSPNTYNDLYFKFTKENKNLNDLMAWAHSKAIENLLKRIKSSDQKIKIIIDQFDFKRLNKKLEFIKDSDIKIIQKTKAESEIPVAMAAILAKRFFEDEIEMLNQKYNLNLKKEDPKDLTKEILYDVAKIHFKNVPF